MKAPRTARQDVAGAIGADAHEVHFTGSATEANNAVLKSLRRHFHPGMKKIISLPSNIPRWPTRWNF